MKPLQTSEQSDIARYADMFAALGAEPRLRIMRTLLAAHPEGMVVAEIQRELGIAPSTLSHHLKNCSDFFTPSAAPATMPLSREES
jgi:DNA-binding transcriptional ArsR family regulator